MRSDHANLTSRRLDAVARCPPARGRGCRVGTAWRQSRAASAWRSHRVTFIRRPATTPRPNASRATEQLGLSHRHNASQIRSDIRSRRIGHSPPLLTTEAGASRGSNGAVRGDSRQRPLPVHHVRLSGTRRSTMAREPAFKLTPAPSHRRSRSRYFRSFTASMNDRAAATWSATVRP